MILEITVVQVLKYHVFVNFLQNNNFWRSTGKNILKTWLEKEKMLVILV